jgi:hypothetical protein
MKICPRVGGIDMNSSRSREVFPEPDGPVRKWKDPGRR